MSLAFPFATLIDPPVKDRIRLEREEVMGYVERITCRTAPVDDPIVFAIFLAVCSPPQQSAAFLNILCRTGTSQ